MKHISSILAMAALLTMVTSCRTPQHVAHHSDTIRIDRWHYDSIDRHHTRTIYQQGDIVFLVDTFYTDQWTETFMQLEDIRKRKPLCGSR